MLTNNKLAGDMFYWLTKFVKGPGIITPLSFLIMVFVVGVNPLSSLLLSLMIGYTLYIFHYKADPDESCAANDIDYYAESEETEEVRKS